MRLCCVECGRSSNPDAKGWRMYHAYDLDREGELVLAAYCPECAVREFGEIGAERKKADYARGLC